MEGLSTSSLASLFSLDTTRQSGKNGHRHHLSVYEAGSDDEFDGSSPTDEISGFYSDEDDEGEKRARAQSLMSIESISYSSAKVPAKLFFPSQIRIPLTVDDLAPVIIDISQTRRPRSLTNDFKVQTEGRAPLSNYDLNTLIYPPSTQSDHGSLVFPAESPTSSPDQEFSDSGSLDPFSAFINSQLLQQAPCEEDSSKTDDCSNLLSVNPSGEEQEQTGIDRGVQKKSRKRSFSVHSKPIFWIKASSESSSVDDEDTTLGILMIKKAGYLSQARKHLRERSINKKIFVGIQPKRSCLLSVQEQNQCSQKIWIHQQNRIRAHQKMRSKFELIPEEDEDQA